ncbi:hypothetical protein, conserved [Eimeria acervulina]|uniref:Uncharacterized protein n=1 Tax=Eimeria acervulina TaxID=5801 RepID=U6GL31_EIMAC|nr:hypothetical protein, conserved [Eimeria acervulina]CDI79304.1 hypothetical protein, conserved [Eimeria acervulina]
MSGEWLPQGPLLEDHGGPPLGAPQPNPAQCGGAPHKPALSPSPDSLWRPKLEGPFEAAFPWGPPQGGLPSTGALEGALRGYGVPKGPRSVSSFSPSEEEAVCESTAPSESFWQGPASPLLTGAPLWGRQQVAAAAAAAAAGPFANGSTVVEVHHLSPSSSFEGQEKDTEAPDSLLLPPSAATADAAAAAQEHSSSSSGIGNGVSPLVQFLRTSKALKMSLTRTMEMQQQTLQLLLLHPHIAPPDMEAPCCWCSAAAANPQQQEQQQQSGCVVLLQIEMLQQLLQQASSQLQERQEDLLAAEAQLQQQQQQEEQQDGLSALLPHWQQQQHQQQLAAAAAELRIRRSVLKHQFADFQEALQLQQQLQQEANARWLLEAADQIRGSFPGAATEQLSGLLAPLSASPWTGHITSGLVGAQLSEKRNKLLKLENKLRELQQLATLLQQQQQKRQQQQQQLATVTTHTEKLTAAACTDLLLAHKYRKQSIKLPYDQVQQ